MTELAPLPDLDDIDDLDNSAHPHDLEAEKAVIGAMLMSEEACSVVAEKLTAEDFYIPTHKVLAAAMLRLFNRGEPVDATTVSHELERDGKQEAVGAKNRIVQILKRDPSSANVSSWADIVRTKALLRGILDVTDKANRAVRSSHKGGPSAEEILEDVERSVYSISQGASDGALLPAADFTHDVLQDLQRRYEEGTGMTGVPSGFPDLDEITAGFQDADLVILGARSSQGKTAFAMDIAWHNADDQKNTVAVFSLEMSKEQLVQRLLGQITKVPVTDLRAGRVPADMWPKLVTAVGRISRAPLYIDDGDKTTVSQMRARLRRLSSRLRAEGGPDISVVVVDYLGLMDSAERRGQENRQQEIASITRGLKRLAKEFQVPVLLLCQLNRDLEKRNDKRPQLSDLRDSGAIEQDADLVLFIHREEKYNPESDKKGTAEIIIGKHRQGPTGSIDLAFHPSTAHFSSMARRDQLPDEPEQYPTLTIRQPDDNFDEGFDEEPDWAY